MNSRSPNSEWAPPRNGVVWLLDCDHTLYSPEGGLMDAIDRRITEFIAAELELDEPEADRLRREYFRKYGTTLTGLMEHHGVEPEPYYRYVNGLELEPFIDDRTGVTDTVGALPGERVVFSNGARFYVERVLEHLELTPLVHGLATIEDFNYVGKPNREPFEYVRREFGAAADRPAVFLDDQPRNLRAAREFGFATVLVGEEPDGSGAAAGDEFDLRLNNLAGHEAELLALIE